MSTGSAQLGSFKIPPVENELMVRIVHFGLGIFGCRPSGEGGVAIRRLPLSGHTLFAATSDCRSEHFVRTVELSLHSELSDLQSRSGLSRSATEGVHDILRSNGIVIME